MSSPLYLCLLCLSIFHTESSPVHFYDNDNEPPVTVDSLNLTLSIATPQLGVPFTASCALSNPYFAYYEFVSFHSSQAGLLAYYGRPHPDGQWIFSRRAHAQTAVAQGSRTAFPLYELRVTELASTKQEYWCTVERDDALEQVYASAHAFTYPHLRLSTAMVEDGDHPEDGRLVTCSIDSFPQYNEKEYTVRFQMELSNSTEQLMAQYTIKPNRLVEFLSGEDSESEVAVHSVAGRTGGARPGVAPSGGAQLEYSITVRGKAGESDLWTCALSIGTEGTPGYETFKTVIDEEATANAYQKFTPNAREMELAAAYAPRGQ